MLHFLDPGFLNDTRDTGMHACIIYFIVPHCIYWSMTILLIFVSFFATVYLALRSHSDLYAEFINMIYLFICRAY